MNMCCEDEVVWAGAHAGQLKTVTDSTSSPNAASVRGPQGWTYASHGGEHSHKTLEPIGHSRVEAFLFVSLCTHIYEHGNPCVYILCVYISEKHHQQLSIGERCGFRTP